MRCMFVQIQDRGTEVLDSILENTDWKIDAIIMKNDAIKNKYLKETNIKDIYSQNDFYFNNDLDSFSYADLQKYKSSQLKFQDCFSRYMVDYQIAKWTFFRGYALAEKIFAAHKFDAVLVYGFNEGRASDGLLMDMAIARGIPVYNIEPMLARKRIVYDNLAKDLVERIESKAVSLQDSLFYKSQFGELSKAFADIYPEIAGNKLLMGVMDVTYRLFGQLGIYFLKCIYTKSVHQGNFGTPMLEQLSRFVHAKYMKHRVEFMGENPDFEQNYIYLSLHFEPEATVMGRAIMESQLMAIHMLSVALPKGWYLYVKEHPDQFDVNTRALFTYHVTDYKSLRFYRELKKIPNVRLIKTKVSSKTMVEHARAVASLSGTVTMEAISLKKPSMVFSGNRTIFPKIHGVYNIESQQDVKDAIQHIENNEIPSYDNVNDVCNRYLFPDDEEGMLAAIKTIDQHWKKSKKMA